MTLKFFDARDDLINYVANDKYILDQVNFPGMCFGLSVISSGPGHYDV